MDDTLLAEWLRHREEIDHSTRSAVITRSLVAALPQGRPVRALDLGTGSGSNVRYLIEHLPPQQEWVVIDRSAYLLAEFAARMDAWASTRGYAVESSPRHLHISGGQLDCTIDMRQQDLDALHEVPAFDGCHVVTASALLDLVSAGWVRALAARCRAVRASALFTLSYDGRSSCMPPEPEDEHVRARLNQHQLRDKGLGGPAAGPDAATCAIRAFTDQGYRVIAAAADWVLKPTEHTMQRMLIDDWARAALELANGDRNAIKAWHRRRLAHLDAGASHITVGHVDFVALP